MKSDKKFDLMILRQAEKLGLKIAFVKLKNREGKGGVEPHESKKYT